MTLWACENDTQLFGHTQPIIHFILFSFPSLPFPTAKQSPWIELNGQGSTVSFLCLVWCRTPAAKAVGHIWSPGKVSGDKVLGFSYARKKNLPSWRVYRLGFVKKKRVLGVPSNSESACGLNNNDEYSPFICLLPKMHIMCCCLSQCTLPSDKLTLLHAGLLQRENIRYYRDAAIRTSCKWL